MEKDNILGKMEEDIKDNINLIKNMDLEHIHGKMVENILDNGKIVKDTVEGKLYLLMELKDKVYGKMMSKLIKIKIEQVILNLPIAKSHDQ